ncbi:MAG: TonB-dependent receptor [Candidatus Solibacter sp.]
MHSSNQRTHITTWVVGLALYLPLLHGWQETQTTAAQNPVNSLKNLSLEELAQVEVTSPSKHPQPVLKSPVAIFVLTGEDIRRSGATSIPEALRQAPGVEVARIDGNKWSVGIRGFGSRLSRSVLVLIDGRTVYTTFFAGTYWEVQDTLLEDIERIEVIRGPGGTIWGPNAVNGVINIITRKAKDTRGTFATMGGGSEEQGFGSVRVGGGNGKGLNYRVYGKGFTRSPQYHPDARNFDDWRGAQTGFRLDWDKSPRDSFTVQGDLYRQEAGERVQATTYSPPETRNVDAKPHLSGGNFMASWNRTLNSGGAIHLQAYYDRTNRHEPNFGELRDTFDVDLLYRAPPVAGQQFSVGLGARFSNGRAVQVVSGLTFDPPQRTDQLLTAFLQDEISLVPNHLTLTLGTKFLHTNYTASEFEPSARILWAPSDKDSVWAAFTHALRTPSRVERDFNLSGFVRFLPDGTPFMARFNANRGFVPEQMNGYEAGYRRLLLPSLYVDVATFYNHYHNLLSQEFDGPIFFESSPTPAHLLLPAKFGNGLRATSMGGEIAPEWRPTSRWRLRTSYAYLYLNVQNAINSKDVGTAPGISRSSPRHQAVVQSAFDISRQVTLDLTYRYASALPLQDVDSYSTGDARLAWRIHRQLEVAITGQNLLQPHHAEFAGDPGPLVGIRRGVYAGVTWRSSR